MFKWPSLLSIQLENYEFMLWNNIIRYTFYSNFATFNDFEKKQSFLKRSIYLSKKT